MEHIRCANASLGEHLSILQMVIRLKHQLACQECERPSGVKKLSFEIVVGLNSRSVVARQLETKRELVKEQLAHL